MEEQIRQFIVNAYEVSGVPFSDADVDSIMRVYGDDPKSVVEVVGKTTGLDMEDGWNADSYAAYLGAEVNNQYDNGYQQPVSPEKDPPTKQEIEPVEDPVQYAIDNGYESYEDIKNEIDRIDYKLMGGRTTRLDAEDIANYQRKKNILLEIADKFYDPIDPNKAYTQAMEGKDASEGATVAGDVVRKSKLMKNIYQNRKMELDNLINAEYSKFIEPGVDQKPSEIIDEVEKEILNNNWESVDKWKQDFYLSASQEPLVKERFSANNRLRAQENFLKSDFNDDLINSLTEWVQNDGQSYRTAMAEWINENMRFDAKILKPVEYLSSAVASGLLQSKQSDILEYDDYSSTIGDKSLEDLGVEDLVRLTEISKLSQEIQEARPSLKTYFGESNFTTFADEAPYAGFSSLISLFTQEELGQSAAVGAAAGTAVGGPMGGLAGGIGYGIAAGMSLGGLDMEFAAIVMDRAMQYAEENDMDANNPNDLRRIFADKEFMSKAISDATIGSGIVFAVDVATLGISGPIAGRAASALFRGASNKAVSNAAISLVVEGAGGATGELLKQLAIEDEIDGMEIALEGGAEFFGPGLGQVIAVNVSEKQKSKARSQIVSAAREGDREGFEKGIDSLYKRNAISKGVKDKLLADYDMAAEIFKSVPESLVSNRANREEAVTSILEVMEIDEDIAKLSEYQGPAYEAYQTKIQEQIDKLQEKKNKLNEYISGLGNVELSLADYALKNRVMANISSENGQDPNSKATGIFITRDNISVKEGVVSVSEELDYPTRGIIQEIVDGTNGATFNESQRVTYDQENDQWIQSSEQVRKEPGTVQDTQGGTQEAQAGGVLQEEGQQQGNQAQGTQEEIKLTDPKPVTLFDVIDTVDEFEGKRVIAVNDTQGNQGTLTIDEGGKVAVDINGQIREIGNVEEIFDTPISELSEALPGLQASGDVQVQGNYTYNFEGNTYANNYSDPLTAINYDENGNVESVTLDRRVTVGGYAGRPTTTEFRSETITGPRAEELALQISLEKLENDGKARQLDDFLLGRRGQMAEGSTTQRTDETNQRVPETGTGQTTSGPQEGDTVAYQKADGTTRELTYQDGRWTFVTESGKPRMYPAPFQGNATRQWEAQQQPTTGQADGATDGAVNYDTLFEKYPSSEQEISDADLVGVLNSFDNMAEMADEGRTGPAPGRRRNPGDYLNEVVNRLRDVLTQETFDRIKGDLNPTGLQATERYFGLTDETVEQATEETTEQATEGTAEQATEETTPSPEEKPAPKPKPKKSDKTKAKEFVKKLIGSRKKLTGGQIIDQIEKVTSAIAKIAPDVKFEVVDSTQMAKLTGTSEARSPRGRYDSSTNTVYINSDKAIGTTIYHEAAHAVMVNMYGDQNPKVVEIHKAIRDVLKNGNKNQQVLAQRIDDFIKNYQQDEGNPYLDSHEFFAELVAQLAANKEIIEAPTITKKIIKAINDVLEDLIGVRPFNSDSDINDVIDFVNTLAVNFESGQTIQGADNLSKKKAEDMNSTFDQKDPITNEEYVHLTDDYLVKGQTFTVYKKGINYRNGFYGNVPVMQGTVVSFTDNAIQLKGDERSFWIPRNALFIDSSGRPVFKANFGNGFNHKVTMEDVNIMRLTFLQYPNLSVFDLQEIFSEMGIEVSNAQVINILSWGESTPDLTSISGLEATIATILDFIPSMTNGLLIDYLEESGFKMSLAEMSEKIRQRRMSKEYLTGSGMREYMLKRYNQLVNDGVDPNDAMVQITADIGLSGAEVKRVRPILEALIDEEKVRINDKARSNGPNEWHVIGRSIPKAVRNIYDTVVKLFTTSGSLPKVANEILLQRKNNVNALNYRADLVARKYQNLVNKNKLPLESVEHLDRILKGANPNNFVLKLDKNGKPIKNPDQVRSELLDLIYEMRDSINSLAQAIADLADPYMEGSHVDFIRVNDRYVARIYKRFETSDWSRSKMGEQVWQKAYNLFTKEHLLKIPYLEEKIYNLDDQIANLRERENLTREQKRILNNLITDREIALHNLDRSKKLTSSEEEMNKWMESLLADTKTGESFMRSGGKIDGTNAESALKARKDIPDVIRDFYGEINDPYVNYKVTIARMAEVHASIEAMESMSRAGMGVFFNNGWTPTFTKEIKKSDSGPGKVAIQALLGGRDSIWTTPEIAEALTKMYRPPSTATQIFFSFNALVKKGFTTWFPKVHVRNYVSNPFFMVSLGHNPLKVAATAVGGAVKGVGHITGLTDIYGIAYKSVTGKELTTAKQRAIREEMLARLVKSGVTGSNVDVNDAKFFMEKSLFGGPKEKVAEEFLYENTLESQADSFKEFVNKPLSAIKNVDKKLRRLDTNISKIYQKEDDYWKQTLFYWEAKRYSEILTGKDYETLMSEVMDLKFDENGKKRKLTEEEQVKLDKLEKEFAKVNDKASWIVNNTLPNYDNIYEFAKKLKGTPILGSFVSFSSEVIRVSLNQVRLSLEELRSNDVRLKKLGAQRLFWQSFVTYLTANLATILTKWLSDWDDDEIDQLNKTALPPWVPEGIWLNKTEDGNVNYINWFTINPYTYFALPIMNAERDFFDADGATTQDILKVFESFTSPFLSPEIGTGTLLYALMNIDPVTGNKVSTAPAGSYRRIRDLWDRFGFVRRYWDKDVQKSGLLAPGMLKTIDALMEPEKREAEIWANTFGVTQSQYKPVQASYYQFKEIGLRKVDIDGQIAKIIRTDDGITDRVRQKVDELSADHEEYMLRALEVVNTMKVAGVEWNTIYNLLSKSSPKERAGNTFRKDEVQWLMSGGKGPMPRYVYKIPKYRGGGRIWSRVNATDRTVNDVKKDLDDKRKQELKDTQKLLESPDMKPSYFMDSPAGRLYKETMGN